MNAVGKHGVWCSFILVAVASSWFGAPVAAIQLPAGFEESVYAQDIVDPRAFGFLPDGRLVVASGPGGVYVADGALTTPVGTIATDTAGERGLNGLAIDPDFSENARIWIYYAASNPVRNRVSRFTLTNGQLGDEVVVLEGPPSQWMTHTGGCLRFAADKTLFISMGDDQQYSTTAQNPYDLRGKILHINRDGTPAPGNPYLLGGGDPRVWALGFRNPFRFNIQPGAPGIPNLFIGDVGAEAFEEIDVAIPGGNFGWANVEGPAPGGLPGYIYPIYAYPHAAQGASVTGGDHARPGDFAPEYTGDYFFGDWVRNLLFRMRLDASNRPISVETWASGLEGPVDIQFGPDGALYYAAQIAGGIRRIAHGAGTNLQPVAQGAAVPDSGPAPLATVLDGSASYDRDGQALTASWSPGDGTPAVPGAVVAHEYGAGVHYARLTVTDPDGGSAITPPIRIVSGNSRPTVAVTAPHEGRHYNAGDTIDFSGSSQDPEDGSLACSRYAWSVLFHHHDHVHPYLGPVQGMCLGRFVTADQGETATDTWYEISLAVDDTGAPLGSDAVLTGRASVAIHPNTATMTFQTQPIRNLRLTLDTQPFDAPKSVPGIVNFRRSIGAPDQVAPDGHTWRFLHWSDGGQQVHEIRTPATNTTYTASFGCDVTAAVSEVLLTRSRIGRLNLTWTRVTDACLHGAPGRYRIYASRSPRPASPSGSFPNDSTFHLIGTTLDESFSYKPEPGDSYFVVVAIGTDGLEGVAGHDRKGSVVRRGETGARTAGSVNSRDLDCILPECADALRHHRLQADPGDSPSDARDAGVRARGRGTPASFR